MAIAALAGSSAAIQATGQIKQGQAQQAAAEYNAKINNQNADIVEQESPIAIDKQQRAAAQNIGATRAQYSASGIDTGSGSALDVIQSSVTQAAMDSATLKYNYDQKAYGLRQSANLESFEGDQAALGSYFGAANTLLSAGGTYAKGKT